MQCLMFGDFPLLCGRESSGVGRNRGSVHRAPRCSPGTWDLGPDPALPLTSHVVLSKSLDSPGPLASDPLN